jgi:peptidoglycan-N-acetylglucosamine deacetylase
MFLEKTPSFIQNLFPQVVWKMSETPKSIYLTFDDGPTPGVTTQVLDFLFQHAAKATFFCTGRQAEKYPNLVDAIRSGGHMVANHGYDHVSGLFAKTSRYVDNVKVGETITGSKVFRPPYGRIMPWQIKVLKNDHLIVMWSIMSMDFNSTPEQCYRNVVENVFPGAIIVFHDTHKASNCLLNVLPNLLSVLKNQGYDFKIMFHSHR